MEYCNILGCTMHSIHFICAQRQVDETLLIKQSSSTLLLCINAATDLNAQNKGIGLQSNLRLEPTSFT